MNRAYDMLDGLEMPAGGPPREWRLLSLGDNRLMREGREAVLTLTPEMAAGAAAVQAAKGEKLPLDSRHALFAAASAAGLDEGEALRQVPQGVAALGFGSLDSRGDGLWLVDAEWTPLAERLFAQGSIRYFSPVVRGLDGRSPFRVTSVALDNVPALTGLDVLAAGGEGPSANITTATSMEASMKTLEEALGRLLGADAALALGGEEERQDAVRRILELIDELAALREKAARADELAAQAQELGAEVAALKETAETARRKGLVDAAMAQGKVCEAQRGVLMGLDSQALGEFLAAIPERDAVPLGQETAAAAAKAPALTDQERELIDVMGLDEEAYLEAKRRVTENRGKED